MTKPTEKEFEAKVLELAGKGMTSEKIGLELKKEKIHSREFKKIGKILKEHKLFKSPDIENLRKRVEILGKHAKAHPQDRTQRRAFLISSSKLKKLSS